jgi:hypothetical protein
MRLFLEEEVRVLAFRKEGVLAGLGGDDEDVLVKGEEFFVAKHGDVGSAPDTPVKKDGGSTAGTKDASTPSKAQATPKKK